MTKHLDHFAFVVPRFGPAVVGGAETLMRALAEKLRARGDRVEILTTCAADNRTWTNDLPPGVSTDSGMTVRRFPVEPRDLEVWIPHQIHISEGLRLNVDDQLDWMAESVNSKALYQHLVASGSQYDAVFFGPYLFGTTFWGSLLLPEKSVLIPCLHDEHYAYQEVVASMFRQVRGALFNSGPEMELACALYGPMRGGEVGMGFEPFEEQYIHSLDPYFSDPAPYLLYLGRKETGKNVQVLIDYFIEAKERSAVAPGLRLVIAGGGSFSDLHRPAALNRGDVIDLEQISVRDKHRLLKHSIALCQPSRNESFSIVAMESWLLGTPVLVHGNCPVTRAHVLESGGWIVLQRGRGLRGCCE